MTTVKYAQSPPRFYCEKCDYGCSKRSCWSQHLLTRKHAKANEKLMPANKIYACDKCNGTFKHQSSYSRHRKTCDVHEQQYTSETSEKELIMILLKQNTELMETIKNSTYNITNNNNSNNNSNNKTFNLNLFLNETCKDAMNIMDFVDSIKLQLHDLENIGNHGFVNGISNIIIKNLKNLDVAKRPLHCTDFKREILYVKDENKWEKENEEKEKIRKAINQISHKNIQQLPEWVRDNPEYKDSESVQNNEYLQIINESMGCTDNMNYNKIIHNISKEVIVEK